MLTYPLVGNYGVPDTELKDQWGLLLNMESPVIHAAGLIVADVTEEDYSHWAAVKVTPAPCARQPPVHPRAIVRRLACDW